MLSNNLKMAGMVVLFILGVAWVNAQCPPGYRMEPDQNDRPSVIATDQRYVLGARRAERLEIAKYALQGLLANPRREARQGRDVTGYVDDALMFADILLSTIDSPFRHREYIDVPKQPETPLEPIPAEDTKEPTPADPSALPTDDSNR